MKNKVQEAFFSFLAFYLFACGIAAIVLMGLLLIPLLIITLFALAIREVCIWKRKAKHLTPKNNSNVEQQPKAIVQSISSRSYKKAA